VTGDWTLRLLLLSLAITPLRRWLRLPALAPLRRTLGLAAFGWACLHVATYAALDLAFDGEALLEDLVERRFVTAGFAAFVCLVPLAATSTRRAQRRLGPRWVRLHRLVYAAAALGIVHYLWLVKADLLPPLLYAAVLAVLLVARLRRPRRAAC
jgi:sulfoxide reductase heme-binding subunit YedZ